MNFKKMEINVLIGPLKISKNMGNSWVQFHCRISIVNNEQASNSKKFKNSGLFFFEYVSKTYQVFKKTVFVRQQDL